MTRLASERVRGEGQAASSAVDRHPEPLRRGTYQIVSTNRSERSSRSLLISGAPCAVGVATMNQSAGSGCIFSVDVNGDVRREGQRLDARHALDRLGPVGHLHAEVELAPGDEQRSFPEDNARYTEAILGLESGMGGGTEARRVAGPPNGGAGVENEPGSTLSVEVPTRFLGQRSEELLVRTSTPSWQCIPMKRRDVVVLAFDRVTVSQRLRP